MIQDFVIFYSGFYLLSQFSVTNDVWDIWFDMFGIKKPMISLSAHSSCSIARKVHYTA
jgi:hypothetical protein